MPGLYDKVAVWLICESFHVWYSLGGLFFFTFSLTDHDVAVFTLSPIIKALHLDIIGGLCLEMSNHVPVLHT